MRRTPVLIIGGGPAGSAAALSLCARGIRPEVVERSSGAHDAVCGGFLGWTALDMLRQLGVEPGDLGARVIERVRLVSGDRVAEFTLPQKAAGISRRRLDAALLAAAEDAGATVRRGRTVRSVDAATRSAALDGEDIHADALILATGKHELRGVGRITGKARQHTAVGLRATLRPNAHSRKALAGTVELHLFEEGYAGLLLQEDGSVNLCLSVSQRRLSRAGGRDALLDELAAEAPLLFAFMGSDLPEKWDAIAGVPYGWRAARTDAGLFRTGDQAAVTASLAGDGISIALSSGMAAANAIAAVGPQGAPEWQARLARRTRMPVALAETMRAAAETRGRRRLMLPVLQLAPTIGTTAAALTRTRG